MTGTTTHAETDAPPTPTPTWTPEPTRAAQSRIAQFATWLTATGRAVLPDPLDYPALHAWSTADVGAFWSAVADFFGVAFHDRADSALATDTMPGAQWFPGATLNIVEHLLADNHSDRTAIVHTGEDGNDHTLTRAQLRQRTAALADHLRRHGVRAGDRVVGYLPHGPEAVIGFLATASLGAVWAVCAQDYAAPAAAARFAQLEPKCLLVADGYRFSGKTHDRTAEAAELLAALPTVTHTIHVDHVGLGAPIEEGDSSSTWQAATTDPAAQLSCTPVPFDHPLWVLFTSGTTGLPKGIVHGHGGVLLEQLAFSALHFDLVPDDVFFWFTSPNWVMWNILVCGLATGAAIVIHDGSPTHPGPAALWNIVADHGVTVFGTSPGYLQASQQAQLDPRGQLDLSRLRIIGSTGSVLPAASAHWVTDHIGEHVQLISVSGGTDICGGFVGGAPTTPTWPGEISAPALGVALHAYDPTGAPVHNTVGEMVITAPLPSMPLRLWNDPDGARYRDTYFSQFPGAWCQGDWITLTDRGTILMHGRSDATLNRNGIRLGSADIYDALADLPEIRDCLVLGVEQPDGTYWMPLFIVLTDGHTLDDELTKRITTRIRQTVSPRHVPDEVLAVPAIPRTRTGKKLEVPLKRLMQGADPGAVLNPATLENAAAVNFFTALAAHRRGRPT